MDWLELNIYTTHHGIEPLSAALIGAGFTGLVISDPEDITEFAENKNPTWDYIDDEVLAKQNDEAFITVYIQKDDSSADSLMQIMEIIYRLKSLDTADEYGRLEMQSKGICEEDWANNWKEFFKPVEIGEKLIIKPTWETLPDDCDRCVVELDPETSFGTGRHFTTQLCLELLEKYVQSDDIVCDLGCGSGIISIAAIALGADSAVGVDIATDAAKIAKANATKNGIEDKKYTVYCGDITTDSELKETIGKGYDLVAANIVSDVLIAMKEIFAEITKPGGILVISGIIDDRREEVLEAVKLCGFTLLEDLHRDIWNAAVYKRDELC